jgi:hypothetical protein
VVVVGEIVGHTVRLGVTKWVGVPVGIEKTVGVMEGNTVRIGICLRVGVQVGVEVGITAIAGGVSVGVDVGVTVDVEVGVSVPVGGVVHHGAVKVKPSNTQVRVPPPLQVVWKTSIWRPGRNSVPCPRSSGGGLNRFPVPIGMETE